MKVLIVDDDRMSLKLLEGYLTRNHYEVVTASNGVEALVLLEKDPDLLLMITDWLMPEMDGLELCRRARLLKRKRYLSIILLTSRDAKNDLIEGLNSGADSFLNKPLNFTEMQAYLNVANRLIDMESKLEAQLLELQKAHTALQDAHHKIEEIAAKDGLTGLLNRRALMTRFEEEWSRAQRYNKYLTIMLLDIDFFKSVNDLHGHLVGDKVLQECSRQMLNSCRLSDIIGRYGGEEFLIITPETNIEEGCVVAERIRQDLSNLTFSDVNSTPPLKITVSLGLTLCHHENDSITNALSRVDEALYQAKHEGRNRVCVIP